MPMMNAPLFRALAATACLLLAAPAWSAVVEPVASTRFPCGHGG